MSAYRYSLRRGPALFGLDIDHGGGEWRVEQSLHSRELDSLYLKAGIISTKAIGRICLLHDMQVFGEENPYADREQVVNAVYGKARETA